MTPNDKQEILSAIARMEERLMARLEEIKPVQGTRWKRQDMPEGWADIALQMRPDIDYMEAYREFQDYWEQATGKKAIKANWMTTWKNWIKRQPEVKKRDISWMNDNVALQWKAASVNITPKPGESWDQLRARVEQRLRRRAIETAQDKAKQAIEKVRRKSPY